HHTGPRVARRNRDGDLPEPQIDHGKVIPHLARIVAAVLNVAEAELAEEVSTPAFDLASLQEGARLAPADRDGSGALARAEVDGRQVIPHLARIIAAVLHVAEAELADF